MNADLRRLLNLRAGVFFTLCLLAATAASAQNAVPLFPCFGKPTSNGCPKIAGTPKTFNPVINKDEYYDVYVESVCINRPDSWWHKKLVHVEVTVKAGKADQTVPVYSQRTGKECRIGVANFPLLTSIPSNNHRLILSAKVYRSDEQDGLKKILKFVTDQQQNTALNTYESVAMPYLTAIGTLSTQVYDDFAQHSENYLYFKPMALAPEADQPSRFDLKDEYVVLYSGNDMPRDSSVYIDNADNLRWVRNGSLVTGGSTWIVFRVQKRLHRRDYPGRPWYEDWEALVLQVETRSVGARTVNSRIAKENTLLDADQDYTQGDKRYYTGVFEKSKSEMIKYLGNSKESASDYGKAVKDARVVPAAVGLTPQGTVMTAATTYMPAATAGMAANHAENVYGFTAKLEKSAKVPVPVDTVRSLSVQRSLGSFGNSALLGARGAVISPEAFVMSLHLLNRKPHPRK